MSRIDDIKESIQQIARINQQLGIVFTAEVVSANDATADVRFGDFIFTEVKLFSIEAAGGLLVKPKVGSMVTVLDLSEGKYRDLVIIKCDTPEQVKMEMNGLTLDIDGVNGKIGMKASGISLLDLMNSITTIIKGLTVSTPAGPSGTPLPTTLQAVTQFETDFKQILK